MQQRVWSAVMGACLGMIGIFGTVGADQSVKAGGFVVHYNAYSADTLQPEIAKLYDITRSRSRGVVVVSVLKGEGSAAKGVKADVSGTSVNLNGQLRELDMREIREGQSLYYVSDFAVTQEETLDFTFSVTPEGGSAVPVKFRQQFFTQ
ncbi:MAG: DUF4426 domain-containing protein [Pseudomonadota bacterium]